METAMGRYAMEIVKLEAEVEKLKAELVIAQAGTKLAIAVAEEEDPRIAKLREALEYLIKMRVIKCLHNPNWPDLSCAKCKADKALKGGSPDTQG